MLSHVDKENLPKMVDVSEKSSTQRRAKAQAFVHLPPEILALLNDGDIQSKKGPVFHTAIIAGTQAAKNTALLIPFCHPLAITGCSFELQIEKDLGVRIECEVKVDGKTGVEMEALTGASVAALTIYDMCKAMSHEIKIGEIVLLEKSGGKSDYLKA